MFMKHCVARPLLYMAVCATAVLSCRNEVSEQSCQDTEVLPEHETTIKWGLNIDSLGVTDGQVGNSDMLSSILLRHGSSMSVAHYVEKESQNTYSVRKIRPGKPYHIVHELDSARTPRFMVYDISQTDYVVYSLSDSIYSYLGSVPTDTVTRFISGSISSSLWNAVVSQGAHPALADMLGDIYSWTIDFFGIQEKDSFAVYYQEVFADTSRVGVGHILAANFITGGKYHYAIRYRYHGERPEYFDENGNSLRRAFLKAPLKYSRISSKFSNARVHPITKVVRAHHGVDYAAPAGTPVYSIGDGIVTVRGWDSKGGGNYLKIRHNGTYTTEYMHLKGFAKGIAQGVSVSQGQLIGYVGATGMATGPHLDFRVFKNGTAIDPLRMDLPAVDPIAQKDMPAYLDATREYMRLIGIGMPDSTVTPDVPAVQ